MPTKTKESYKNNLPDGWTWKKLGEIADLVGGGTPSRKKPEYFTGDIVWLTPTQIPKERVTVVRDSDERITEQGLKKSSAKLVPEGSVLLTSRATIGNVAIAGTEVTTNQGFASFICKEGVFNQYLAYWLWANVDLLIQNAKGTTFKEISKSKLKTISLPLPPFPEQQSIVAKIEELLTQLDAAVAGLRRAKANLARYKASVLKAACEGRLVPTEAELAREEGREYESGAQLLERILAERKRKWEEEQRAKGKDPGKLKYKPPAPPDTEDLPELPEGWVCSRVDQIGIVQLGRQRSPKHHTGPYMRPYLRAANITWKGLDLSDVMEMNFPPSDFETYRLESGDVLVSEASGSRSEVGKPAIWKDQLPGCCFQNTLIRVRSEGPLPEYLYIHFLKDAITGRFGQIAKGVGIHHLGATRISAMVIGVPPLAEQEHIVDELERQLSIINAFQVALEGNLNRANRMRQAILKRAFEGKLVP